MVESTTPHKQPVIQSSDESGWVEVRKGDGPADEEVAEVGCQGYDGVLLPG